MHCKNFNKFFLSKNNFPLNIAKSVLILIILFLGIGNSMAQTKVIPVKSFNKVIVSPHIQVNFEQGDKETVIIEDISVAIEKFKVEENGKTLQIYLEGAKTTTKSEKHKGDNYTVKSPIYQGTIVKATIIYKHLEELSLRGEQNFICKDPIKSEKFNLKIYGESEVLLNEVDFNSLNTSIYGESTLKIKSGKISKHKITAYGESEVKMLDVDCESVKITAYGEGEYHVMVSKDLKVTAYGEAEIEYKGNPIVNKGIIIGDAEIKKYDQ